MCKGDQPAHPGLPQFNDVLKFDLRLELKENEGEFVTLEEFLYTILKTFY